MSDAALKLGYGIPKDTSVVVNRTTKTYKFLHNTYNPGDIATCTFPTGTDYIDTRRSFLEFEFNNDYTPPPPPPGLPGETLYSFGVHGSMCNVIQQICIYSRTGDELCRIEDFNLLSNMLLPLTYDREWFSRQGAGMWHGNRLYNSKQTAVIPMYILSPLFGYGRLLPAALVSGMRVELTLESADKVTFGAQVFIDIAQPPYDTQEPANGTNYFLSDMYFNVEVVKLGDSIRMAMDEIISTKGIELVYTGWHHTFTEPGHDMQNNTTIMIRDSHARALRAFARIRSRENGTETNSIHPETQRDSFRGEHIFPIAEYQWRHGERYYPDGGVKNGNRPIIESYVHVLNAVNQYDGSRGQSLLPLFSDDPTWQIPHNTMLGFLSTGFGGIYPGFMPSFVGQIGSYVRDSHVIGVDLTRDSENSLSGRPVNNVEPLSLTLKCNDNTREYQYNSSDTVITAPPLRRLDVFMEYAKLVRVFTNNIQVEK